MRYELFKECVLKHLASYKNEFLGITESGEWLSNKQEYPHILPKRLKMVNLLPTVTMPDNLSQHRFCHHLNSSQFMCINFFQPLFNDIEGNCILMKLLGKTAGIEIPTPAGIEEYSFEHSPCENEGTNFDLYIRLTNGTEIYFEIKYTEDCFGKTGSTKDNPNKYKDKWNGVYFQHVKNSLYLQNIEQDTFYTDYQIWRNISYIKNENNYSLFIIPHENEKLITELRESIGFEDNKRFENAKVIYWSSFVSNALELSRNTKYYQHFKLFYDKYLDLAISENR